MPGRQPTAAASGTCVWNLLRPSDANGMCDIDRSKTTKGRHMGRELIAGAKAPAFTLSRDGGGKVSLRDFKAGTAILGVSADPVTAQDKFKAKHRLSIVLGSDETKDMLTAYGAWGEKSMYGRKFMGVLRKTFLIGADTRIIQIWPKVRVPGHAQDVLLAARNA